jgi:hypothetical protein
MGRGDDPPERCDKLQAMGATLYIVVEGEDPGFSREVNAY